MFIGVTPQRTIKYQFNTMLLDYIYLPSLLTYAILALVLLALFYDWYKRPKSFPPGPRGIPFVGVLPFLGKYPERTMKKWSETYGDIMSIRMGPKDMVVLNSFESIQQAFVKQSTQFSGRPDSEFFLKIQHGHGIKLRNYSKMWKEQRKFGLLTLRGFGVGKRSMEAKIIDEITYLIEAVKSKNGKPFDISFLLNSTVSNVICKIVLGKRYKFEDPEFKTLYMLVEDFDDPTMNLMSILFGWAPILSRLPFFSRYGNKFISDARAGQRVIDRIIEEHEQNFDEEDIKDFIDAFLVELYRNTDESYTRKQLRHFIVDLFVAGTGSTASTIYWGLLCFMHYPDAQKRFREEILNVIGYDGQISLQKRSELPYTCAVIEELFRFRTLSPLSIVHATTENAVLGKYFIPKNTPVSANQWAVNNDKTLWKSAEMFNPERFFDSKGEFVKPTRMTAFSAGPRMCLGEHLARMEVFIVLVSVVRRFEILPDSKAECLPDIEGGSSGQLFVPHPYKLVAKEI